MLSFSYNTARVRNELITLAQLTTARPCCNVYLFHDLVQCRPTIAALRPLFTGRLSRLITLGRASVGVGYGQWLKCSCEAGGGEAQLTK